MGSALKSCIILGRAGGYVIEDHDLSHALLAALRPQPSLLQNATQHNFVPSQQNSEGVFQAFAPSLFQAHARLLDS